MRFDADGLRERRTSSSTSPPTGRAKILVTAENFGCGSSREAAVWALMDYGIRRVIAPSFGDIFFENCFKNGVLAVVLPPDVAAALRRAARTRGRAPR